MSRALQLSEKFKSAGTDALKASQDASKDPAVDADDENGRLQRAGWSCGVRYVLYAAKAFFVFLDTKLLVQMVSSTRWMSNSSAGISKRGSGLLFEELMWELTTDILVYCRACSGKRKGYH